MTDGVNNGRRTILIGVTAGIGAIGAAGVAVPFVKSWNPSAKAEAAGAPVVVDASKIEPGKFVTVDWRGKPVWVLRRTQETLDDLEKNDDVLLDPESVDPQQPAYAQNDYRSIKPEFLVLVAKCTHLGCSPKYQPDVTTETYGRFFCPCHGSKFDLAGRVFKNVPAPKNLEVPPHSYLSDSVIIIGVESEEGETA